MLKQKVGLYELRVRVDVTLDLRKSEVLVGVHTQEALRRH